jgi:methanogenic corrinoid protein MtbC1
MTTTTPDRGFPEGIETLRAEADEFARWATEEYCRRHPDLILSPRGRELCREDMRHHIEFLHATALTHQPGPFVRYTRWLRDLLQSRGMNGAHVARSLELIPEYFTDRLPEAALAWLRECVAAALDGLADPRPEPLVPPLTSPALPETGQFLEALLASDRRGAEQVLVDGIAAGRQLVDVGVGIVQPAMYEIGRLWQENRISVAQEHLATALSQNALVRAFALATFRPLQDRRIMLGCVPGNQHCLGLRVVSDALEADGWQVQYLGADVPEAALLAQIRAWRPQWLALSLSMPQQLPVSRNMIVKLKAELGGECPRIMVGGLAVNSVEELWKTLGADLWTADARAACRQLT